MIKAIAIDDERNALGVITQFANRIPGLELSETFTDPLKVVPFLYRNPDTDLLFLDIQMAKMNGLDLAKQISKGRARIILTTAYPNYALQGFDLDVIDYLLKPFSFERFDKAVNKAMSILASVAPTADTNKSIEGAKLGHEEFIFVRSDYKTIKVSLSDILYIEGTGNYVSIHTRKGKILSLQNMKTFEDQLRPFNFFRIHKSFIISIQHIDSIGKKSIFINHEEIPIGDTFRDPFNDYMKLNFKQF
jgi:DNA-binding LytR/AlgR family response regulator